MKTFKDFILECELVEMSYKKLPVGKMIKQAARQGKSERVAKMGKVADDHDPYWSKRKEDDNRREGGLKRGGSGWNDFQDNW